LRPGLHRRLDLVLPVGLPLLLAGTSSLRVYPAKDCSQ